MTTATNEAITRIETYIAATPEAMQSRLRRMRELIRSAAPEAVEVFAYGVPGFKYRGHPLVYYGAAKKHYSLYGVSPALIEIIREDLTQYDTSKGTIRFAPDEAVPEQLVTKLILARVAENNATEIARKAKARERRKK